MKIKFEILLPLALTAVAVSGCNKAEVPDPELNIVSETLQVGFMGGDCELAYELVNPVEGCHLEAVPEVDWIEVSEASAEGVIVLKVLQNTSKEQRTGSVALNYDYGDGLFINGRVTLTQEGCPYDYVFNATEVFGSYYASDGDYYTYLSDAGVDAEGYPLPGGTYYLFDIYVIEPYGGSGDVAAPEGTYEITAEGDNFVSSDYSEWFRMDDSGSDYEASGSFESGTLTISKDEAGNWVYDAVITDDEGKTHWVRYTGPVNLEN